MSKVKIISSATSDLYSDQRVHRICQSLQEMGFEVEALGRRRPHSPGLENRSYGTSRLKCWFDKGPLFYAEYNLRLFFYLKKSDADLLLANDLDTLPANAMASKILGCPLVYDSHEYFTEVPELQSRSLVRGIWKMLERRYIKKVNRAMTVSDSIAKAYFEKYGIEFYVIRNLPAKVQYQSGSEVESLRNGDEKIIIYQGSVNVDRGLEEMISAMNHLENVKLVIIGEGDVLDDLKLQVDKEGLATKVKFLGRVPFSELPAYTRQGDIGISIEKKNGLSYTYALPNKVFDYLQSGLPVVISDLPELTKLNTEYDFAHVIPDHKPENIAKCIRELLGDQNEMNDLRSGAKKAAEVLNWEEESVKLRRIFSDFLDQDG